MPGWLTTLTTIVGLLPTIIGIIKDLIEIAQKVSHKGEVKQKMKDLHKGLKKAKVSGDTSDVENFFRVNRNPKP